MTLVLVPAQQLFVPSSLLYTQYYQMLSGDVFLPNTPIIITVPVTSLSSVGVRTKVTLKIYEGSILPGTGTLLATIVSNEQTIAASATANFSFNYTTTQGSIDRRDVGALVSYFNGTIWVDNGSSQWDDLFYVQPAAYAFTIGVPTVRAA